MSLNIVSNNEYDIITLQGSISISSLPTLTPQLSEYFQEYSPKDVVIDLTDVSMIDSSVIRLLLNVKKRIESSHNHLYLMRPSEDLLTLLTDSNLDKVITIISDLHELQKILSQSLYDRYLPFTYKENDMLRISCSCGACGSQNVIGYLFDTNAYTWKWRENDIFPYSEDKNGNPFDYYSIAPIICLECMMSSTNILHFNILDSNKNVHFRSNLNDKSKIALSKTTKKRKKMIESIKNIDNHFLYPRNQISSFNAYLLAETSSKSLFLNNENIDPFNIGYMNFLAIHFAPEEQIAELVNNCRTWLSQIVSNPLYQNKLQIAQSLYVLMNASLKIDKVKEASKYYTDISNLINTIAEHDRSSTSITSPMFWFVNAQKIWEHEIEKKSAMLK